VAEGADGFGGGGRAGTAVALLCGGVGRGGGDLAADCVMELLVVVSSSALSKQILHVRSSFPEIIV
jgi:hypothetical protein